MNIKAIKTPLLIVAMAAAVALNTFVPATAAVPPIDTQTETLHVFEDDFQTISASLKFNNSRSLTKFDQHNALKQKKSATTHSFGAKEKFEPKYSFTKKKGLRSLF